MIAPTSRIAKSVKASAREPFYIVCSHLRAISSAEIPAEIGFSELRPIGLAQLLPGLRRNPGATVEVELLQPARRNATLINILHPFTKSTVSER